MEVLRESRAVTIEAPSKNGTARFLFIEERGGYSLNSTTLMFFSASSAVFLGAFRGQKL
jgi:hypothetical protein